MTNDKLQSIITSAEELKQEIEDYSPRAAAYAELYDALTAVQYATAHCLYVETKPETFFKKELPEKEFQEALESIIEELI